MRLLISAKRNEQPQSASPTCCPIGTDAVSSLGERRITAWLRRAALVFAFISGVAMLLMMLAGTFDIVGTNVFAKPIPAAFEFMAAMMVVVVFFAVPLAQARQAHIRVEVICRHLPAPLLRVVDAFQYVLNISFYGLIAYFGFKSAMLSFAQGEYASGIINFPIWPARFALCFGASLMVLVCLHDLVRHLCRWSPLIDSGEPKPSP